MLHVQSTCHQHPKSKYVNVSVFHCQFNFIMQTPMKYIKFGLILNYWYTIVLENSLEDCSVTKFIQNQN